MKSVLCFGEALIDFLNTSVESDGELSLKTYCQYPGGAPANAAVAVAKLGGKALFAGQVGKDVFGDFLEISLQKYNVNTQFLHRHPTAKTALAFVNLDETGERNFAFYRDNTADLVFSQEQVSNQWFDCDTIFHFCSNTLTQENIAQCTSHAVKQALENQVTISFDVNLRHNLWPNSQATIEIVNELVLSAHVLKFSIEEFAYLSEGEDEKYINYCFSGNCELLLITNGEHHISFYTQTDLNVIHLGIINPPEVVAVDTTAAGDGFMGGILFSISQYESLTDLIDDRTALKNGDKVFCTLWSSSRYQSRCLSGPSYFSRG